MTVTFFTRYGRKITLIKLCSLINLSADLLKKFNLFVYIKFDSVCLRQGLKQKIWPFYSLGWC